MTFIDNKDVNEKKRLNNFFDYVNINHCKCINTINSTCYNEIYTSKSKPLNCNKIEVIDKNEKFLKSIDNIIDLFVDLGFIYKIKPIENDDLINFNYYLRNGNILNWENIIKLKDKTFWFFRKAIIDCLIKYAMNIYNAEIYSVGSTKLISDYDLTIYSRPKSTVYIIKLFNDLFYKIFNNNSNEIFDTNIYGKGFIEFSETINYIKSECNLLNFYYIPYDTSYNDSQLMWGLVKFLSSVKSSLGLDIYNNIYSFMNSKFKIYYSNNSHLQIASHVLNNLSNEKIKYESILENQEYILSKYPSDNKLLKITDYISLLNFFGTDTYYTRGAFMDIVVKTQMCKNASSIELYFEDYMNSIIENVSFFLIHNEKDKYLIRIIKSLNDLLNIDFPIILKNKLQNRKNIIELTFSNISKLNNNNGKICSYIKDLNVSKCIKYDIFEILLKLIYDLIHIYLDIEYNINKSPLILDIPLKNINITAMIKDKNYKFKLATIIENVENIEIIPESPTKIKIPYNYKYRKSSI